MEHVVDLRMGGPERGDEGADGGVGDADGGGVDEDSDWGRGEEGEGRGEGCAGERGEEGWEVAGDFPGGIDGVLGSEGL